MKYQKSCGGVVFYRGKKEVRFLILKHSLGHWDFPKGLIEKGEAEEQTALREIQEETGLTSLKIIKPIHKVHYVYQWKGQLMKKHVQYFLVESKNRKVDLSHEHTECAWLPFEEAMAKVQYKNQKETLRKAHAAL